jgi:ribosomal-protein-alanine N-acetyltransferase
MEIPTFETARLLLPPLELADAEQVQQLFPRWEIVRYLADAVPWPYPPDGALTYYRDIALPAIARCEQWHWTLRRKAQPATIIGSIGLIRGDSDNRGFWVGVPWQGQGFMSEAIEPVTDFWFNTLCFPRLRAPKAAANLASRKISEKEGMRLVALRERNYVSGRLPEEVWELTREEWNARKK